jgi:hypothetical protein
MMRRQQGTKNQRFSWEILNKVLVTLREHGTLTTPQLIKTAGLASCFSAGRIFLYNEMLTESGSQERLVAKKGSGRVLMWSLRIVPTARELAEKFDMNPLSEENHRKNLACARTRQRRP